MRSEMGMGRATGVRSPGFITSVLNLIERFYGGVLQQITPWQPPAPKLAPKTEPEPSEPTARYDPFRWAIERPEVEEGSENL
jgi:hypothetical protein